MTATISLVEATHPDGLTAAAGRMQSSISAIKTQIATQVKALTELSSSWQGAAASAAIAKAQKNLQQQQALMVRLTGIQSALSTGGANLTPLRTQILSMAAQAAALGGLVADDGTVTATGSNRLMTPALAGAYTTSLKTMLQQFDAVDRATASSIRAGGGPPQAPAPEPAKPDIETLKPPDGATDTEVNQWWDSLSEEERQRLVDERPEWIGNLDGIPATKRDQANRNRLDDLAAKGDLTDEERATLDAINHELFNPDGSAVPDRQLLVLDFSQRDKPKVAIAVGNVETADNVSVFVPGTGMVTFDGPGGNDLPTYVDQAEWLRSQAESVARLTDPNATVATIAWLGYEPPSNLAKAGLPGYADDAAPGLASFINGLDSSRDTDPNLTVIGHSYGSVVASEALQRGTAADNVIFMGSPGLETNPLQYFSDPTPEKFHLTEGHVFVEHARNDVVADLGRFGGRIVSGLPGFIDLSTNAESTPLGPTTESTGHSEYSLPDTTALYNQAVVVAGLGADPNFVRDEA